MMMMMMMRMLMVMMLMLDTDTHGDDDDVDADTKKLENLHGSLSDGVACRVGPRRLAACDANHTPTHFRDALILSSVRLSPRCSHPTQGNFVRMVRSLQPSIGM